jgi:predicted secreted protein
MRRWFSALLLLPLVTSCSFQRLTFDEADNGTTVQFRASGGWGAFYISLQSNPTTGFDWFVVEGAGDVVAQVGDGVYESDERAGNVPGAGGTTTFEFDVIAEGATTLVLHYMRSWEDVEPEDTFELTVNVTE